MRGWLMLFVIASVPVAAPLAWLAGQAAGQEKPSSPPAAETRPADNDLLRVGAGSGQQIVVPTNQVLSPAGRQVAFSGRPTDVALSPNGRWLAVLDRGHVATIDPQSAEIVSRLPHGSGSYAGILFTPDGKRLLASNIRGSIGVFAVGDDGHLTAEEPIRLPLAPGEMRAKTSPTARRGRNRPTSSRCRQAPKRTPCRSASRSAPTAARCGPYSTCGIRWPRSTWPSAKLFVRSRSGSAPYGVVVVKGKAYVSNWAGRHPGQKDATAPSGVGSPVRVDPQRFIASDGSVSVVDLKAGQELKQIVVGLHPAGIAATPDGRTSSWPVPTATRFR